MTVITGLEALRKDDFALLAGQRVGLLTNPSAVDRNLVSVYRILADSPQVKLAALFGPEHGFAGHAADAVQIDNSTDARTGLPVFSLYGATMRPTPAMLEHIDVLVCDIQDIGVRYYTFAWTITYALEAAGAVGLPVIILDRPNPLGDTLRGPLLEPAQESEVGRFAVPVCHGLTLGELVRLVCATWLDKAPPVTIVPCDNWERTLRWPETGLPWVLPSPNMPTYETARHYPGACLIEGTNLSEGRGTALPFQIVGAPFIQADALADHLNAQGWPGVRFRPLTFEPTFSKWTGQVCGGVQVYGDDDRLFDPLAVWLGVIAAIRRLYPADFDWHPRHFDRLIGTTQVREQITAGVPLADIMAGWSAACEQFDALRRPFLLK